MKKIGLLLLLCVFLAGCGTTTATREQVVLRGEIEKITLLEKDFTVVGMIFLTSTATIDANGLIIDGSPITYEMLLKEAQKLEADDIANLRIDEIHRHTEFQTLNRKRYDYGKYISTVTNRIVADREITYNATALAIKYISK